MTFIYFINKFLDYYGLDPCYYFSSPGLSWDAMLNITGIELVLISDIDVHLFIERGMRGDVSYIDKIHSKANNKNTWSAIIVVKKVNTLLISMQIICMFGQ